SGFGSVAVSIQQTGGGCWTGTGSSFAASCPNFVAATGTTAWSLPFVAGNFPAGGEHTITARATALPGNTATSSASTIAVDYDPAASIFVATSGSDANNGQTPGAAVATINNAISKTTATRNVIVVSGGSYNQTVTVSSGTAGVSIRGGYSSSSWLRAAPGG